jgi:hypothetical protein
MPASRSSTVSSRPRQVHYLTIGVAAFILIYESTREWFFLDEWDFLANRGVQLGRDGVFFPHNEHWSTIPILIWRALFNLVGVRYHWLYTLPLIIAALGAAHLLWRLMLRHNVDPWFATLLAASFMVLGVGWQDLIWAFQIGFVGSLAFGLLAIDAIEREKRYIPALWGLGAVMCSGLGVPMVIAAALVALAHRRVRVALVAALVPGAAFAIWWVAIGHSSSPTVFTNTAQLPLYIWTGLTAALAGYLDLPRVVGAVLIVALAATAVWLRSIPAVLAASSVTLFAFVGIGRLQDGAGEAAASRYSFVAVALLLPLAGQFLTTVFRHRNLRVIVDVALIGLIGINVLVLHREATTWAVGTQYDRLELPPAAYLVDHGERFLGDLPAGNGYGFAQSTLTLTKLTQMVKNGQFPVPAKVSASELATERAVLTVSATARRAFPAGLAFANPKTPTCVNLGEGMAVAVTLAGPGSLRLTSSSPLRYSQTNPLSVSVQLNPAPGATQTGSAANIGPTDRWLNLPGGGYVSAVVTAFNGPMRVCETASHPG